MALLYYKMMNPQFLRENATWDYGAKPEPDDTKLIIPGDTRNDERIFKILLAPKGSLEDCGDITVKIKVGIEMPAKYTATKDTLSVMLTDDRYAIGFQLRDVSYYSYNKGPLCGAEGDAGRVLGNKKTFDDPDEEVRYVYHRNDPDQFELVIKPKHYWGTAYTALEGGNVVSVGYGKKLDMGEEMNLEVYRGQSDSTYKFKYFEVSIYAESPVDKRDLRKSIQKNKP